MRPQEAKVQHYGVLRGCHSEQIYGCDVSHLHLTYKVNLASERISSEPARHSLNRKASAIVLSSTIYTILTFPSILTPSNSAAQQRILQ